MRSRKSLKSLPLAIGILLLISLACSTEVDKTATPTQVSSYQSTSAIATPTPSQYHIGAIQLPSVPQVVTDVKPSVVSIVVNTLIEQCDFFFGCRLIDQDNAGTGVIFDPDGLIVTNNHVISGADSITVILIDERIFEGEIVGQDPASDLAVIKIPEGSYQAIEFADPAILEVGHWVIAIGNALALEGGPTVTMGIVGALDRSIMTQDSRLFDMIQTDAAINPGNSGGPLVNLDGQVVGINTARSQSGDGIGFAVSTFTVIPVVESILAHGRVVFSWLGVGVRDVTPVIAAQQDLSVSRGVFVSVVQPDGPAVAAGIRAGDIITRFDTKEVSNVKQLQKAVREYSIGHKAEVTIMRGNELKTLQVTLEEQPRG